jgi:hypothetical protein
VQKKLHQRIRGLLAIGSVKIKFKEKDGLKAGEKTDKEVACPISVEKPWPVKLELKVTKIHNVAAQIG